MKLRPDEAERYYRIWWQLMWFANREEPTVPPFAMRPARGAVPAEDGFAVREVLWCDTTILARFLAENPGGLPAQDLALASSWRDHVRGSFLVVKHLQKHSLLIDARDQVYAVLGISDSIATMLPSEPCLVEAFLLPFEGRIILDCLVRTSPVLVGPGIRRGAEATIRGARERGAIVASLPPPAGPAPDAVPRLNQSILGHFRRKLATMNMRPETADRHVANVAAVAERLIDGTPPATLLDLRWAPLAAHLGTLDEKARQQAVTSFTRFVRFLLDTDRAPIDRAEQILARLRGR